MTELLSPVGSPDTLTAALINGADAVYLGLKDFSARASAGNFTLEQYATAYRSCRAAGVKVYVTLNTLLHDREIPAMESAIRFLAETGCDGIIVQDLATARLAREIAPALPLHASTQMCIYNVEGALLLKEFGFVRVVVARELTKAEIARIIRETGLEVEVFVHGALCMCYSGHCYFSAVLGRNSGNRGRCAQPCRLPYGKDYPLSLKDLSLIEHINELRKMGVASLKIEGRLKSAEYVGGVTRVFYNALQGNAPDRKTLDHLAALFSREGFTDGYFENKTGREMFGIKLPTPYKDFKEATGALCGQKPIKRFTLSLTLRAYTDRECVWTFSDGVNILSISSPPAALAASRPLDSATLRERLNKLTDTHYSLGECTLQADKAVFLPVSLINDMRKSGIAALDATRAAVEPMPCGSFTPQHTPVKRKGGLQILYRSPTAFCKALDHSLFSVVWLRPEDIALYTGDNRGVHIDHFYPADKLSELLDSLWQQGVRKLLVGNLGHILPAREKGFTIYGDYGLNVTNSLTLAELQRMGVENALLSFELSLPRAADTVRSIPTTLLVYGRLPLMTYRCCVMKNRGQCIGGKGFGKLTDRKNETFLLACRPGCGNILYNSLPLYLTQSETERLNDADKRFDFTDETPKRVLEIIQSYLSGETPEGAFTHGLYRRGVI